MADETEAARSSAAAAAVDEEVKAYKIRVSSKYIELTKQKLELTRLPHETPGPGPADWWQPKDEVEPLIDFWLERYSWRDQEVVLNRIPQFRTAISIAESETPLRLHFVHFRSPHANAVPLLLIPPFPLTNLSFGHLVKPFTDPEDAASDQPFHLVIPTLPGLGFSAAFPNNVPIISNTAEMLNTVMKRLSYDHYLATNAGAASASPAEIDWRLINYLATHYTSSCVGAHFVSPPLARPKIREDPWEWTKWSLANLLHTGILGYSDDDFAALDRVSSVPVVPVLSSIIKKKVPLPAEIGLNQLGMREPNTLAYALCDSPTGLLLFVMKGLSLLSPGTTFTPEQIINTTKLAWVPGPEYAMRFWAYCVNHREDESHNRGTRGGTQKPRVGITVFTGEPPRTTTASETEGTASDNAGQAPHPEVQRERYVCPAWGNAKYNIAFTQRISGRPGLLGWERPEVLISGVRGLAREVLKADRRLRPAVAATETAPLEQVVVSGPEGRPVETPAAATSTATATATATAAATSTATATATATAPDVSKIDGEEAARPGPVPVIEAPAPTESNNHLREPQIGERGISDETIVVQAGDEDENKAKDADNDTDKGKGKDMLRPEAAALGGERSSSSLLAEKKSKVGQGPSDETIVAGTPPASR